MNWFIDNLTQKNTFLKCWSPENQTFYWALIDIFGHFLDRRTNRWIQKINQQWRNRYYRCLQFTAVCVDDGKKWSSCSLLLQFNTTEEEKEKVWSWSYRSWKLNLQCVVWHVVVVVLSRLWDTRPVTASTSSLSPVWREESPSTDPSCCSPPPRSSSSCPTHRPWNHWGWVTHALKLKSRFERTSAAGYTLCQKSSGTMIWLNLSFATVKAVCFWDMFPLVGVMPERLGHKICSFNVHVYWAFTNVVILAVEIHLISLRQETSDLSVLARRCSPVRSFISPSGSEPLLCFNF